jgi:hypothetical protein
MSQPLGQVIKPAPLQYRKQTAAAAADIDDDVS